MPTTSDPKSLSMKYNGSKNSCYQRIINYMPPHRIYIETHAGSAAIARHKLVAEQNILIDIDSDVIARLRAGIDTTVYNAVAADCVEWLQANPPTPDTLIYADPPYVMSKRSCQRDYYRHEYTDADHIRLLDCLKSLDCMVLISGYESQLYTDMLPNWNTATFTAQSRGGIRNEHLWYNYPEPKELHDYSYLGDTYTERQRIKRKAQRWSKNFHNMPRLEKLAIIRQMKADGDIA